MLKSVSSITNAIGALNFKGTWDANANSPALASSVGTKGDYYVVGTAGSTNLNGISNWGVGDLATFNGSVWQRVEGGADLNGVNLSVSGTSTLSGLTASTALALNASKEVVSVTNTGTGDNVLATSPTFVTPILGTPQSGVVTNLTGTASININGTVGATTPSTGVFTDLRYTTNLASYLWSIWNPSDLVGTSTNAPNTGTADDSNFVTMANSSGTLTITFDIAGKYFICINQQTFHASSYTFDRQTATLGGTATRRIHYDPTNSGVDSNDSNFSISSGFYVDATATQTLTILPTYELSGAGTTANHVAACNVTIQYCGG